MRYTAFLPIAASAEFELITDEELTGDALVEAFLDKATPVSRSLCWQCSTHTDTDCEPAIDDSFVLDANQITVE